MIARLLDRMEDSNTLGLLGLVAGLATLIFG